MATPAPTKVPTKAPSTPPTNIPTMIPTTTPTLTPTKIPTMAPTNVPTQLPTTVPTTPPSTSPTKTPTRVPTVVPTQAPTRVPTAYPTAFPTPTPTGAPTATSQPTHALLTKSEKMMVFGGAGFGGTLLLICLLGSVYWCLSYRKRGGGKNTKLTGDKRKVVLHETMSPLQRSGGGGGRSGRSPTPARDKGRSPRRDGHDTHGRELAGHARGQDYSEREGSRSPTSAGRRPRRSFRESIAQAFSRRGNDGRRDYRGGRGRRDGDHGRQRGVDDYARRR